jgi:sugar phosphate isomerase/epimerase
MELSRRALGKLAAASLAAGGSGAAPARAGVVIGVQSYSFRDRSLDAALAAMRALGVGVCELAQSHVEPRELKDRAALRRWRLETPDAFYDDIRARFRDAGVDVHAYNLSVRDDFTDDEIERGFAAAKRLGAKVMTGSANQSAVPRVAAIARNHRMRYGVHNHSRVRPNEFATAADLEAALRAPGREYIAVNLDIGHYTAANFDAREFLATHHDRIVTLHVKDRFRNEGAIVPFGQGQTPIKEVLGMLRDNAWAIPANIEYEYDGADTVEEVRRCLAFCRQAVRS